MPNISPASIAVLPFAYRGDDQKEAYLAEAITEELTVGLTKFEGLAISMPHLFTIQALTLFSLKQL
jgi:TolB-like protein